MVIKIAGPDNVPGKSSGVGAVLGESADFAGNFATAEEYLSRRISNLVMMKPLYGVIFLNIKHISDNTLPTMAVGPYRRRDIGLFYNPDFVKSLTETELENVLIHEALHLLLVHIERASFASLKHRVYNIAADVAINCNLAGLPSWCYFPESFPAEMGMEKFKSAEWYYAKIIEQAEKNGKSLEEFLSECSGSLLDDHSKWEEVEGDSFLKNKIRYINGKAIKAQQAKGWGNMPGEMVQEILAANTPTVNWKRELRYFVNKQVQAARRSTRSKPNRRYGYINPGFKKDYITKILVAMDTSGSVSEEDMSMFLAEMNSMQKNVKLDAICFDTELYGEPKKFDKRRSSYEFKGRGGTNFGPVIELAEQSAYTGVIIMTDGGAPFPDPPKNCKVLWCITEDGKNIHPPYGKRVVMEAK